MAKGGQPIIIIDPRKEQTKGREALSMNIAAAKAVASLVKSTLGPRGMDKMLINVIGDITVTNDGASILKDMSIEHPSAKMVVEVAKSLEDTAGDGTTSSVVFTGALLEKAEGLIEKGVHPTVVIKGYRLAASKATEILENIAIPVKTDNREILQKVAETSIAGKAVEKYNLLLAKICVDAVLAVQERGRVDLKDVLISKDAGRPIEDTEFVDGIVIDKVALDRSFKLRIENPKIAVIDTPMEVGKTATTSKLQVHSMEERKAFLESEEASLYKIADYVLNAGATALFCGKGVDDRIANYLQRRGVYVTRRVKADDMQHISDASGARTIRNIRELEAKDLGHAGSLEQDRNGDQGKTYLKGCAQSKAVSIVIRGGTEHVVDNIERALDDALRVVKSVVEDGKIVGGGGASEIELALVLRAYASSVGSREQMAINAFADAIEEIPRTIAKNAGMDAIDSIVNLRSKHVQNKNAGLDVMSGEIIDMVEKGIVDPLRVKLNTIKAGSEAAEMVLRIDNILRAQKSSMPDIKPEHMASTYDGMAAPALNQRR